MSIDAGLTQVIAQAQRGDKASTDRLAEVARQRLFPYIYRLTLDPDLTQDLLQETLLKMIENLSTLQQPEHFWHWLFRTALGVVQHHYRDEAKARTVAFSTLDPEGFSRYVSAQHDDGLNHAMRKELSEAVVARMAQLNLAYRNVLVLRCYEQMSYSEIAEQLGCKELRARVLFFRAKHALSRRHTIGDRRDRDGYGTDNHAHPGALHLRDRFRPVRLCFLRRSPRLEMNAGAASAKGRPGWTIHPGAR
jgi:RNA polymerase sigma factor (sigma-70 family)